MRIISVRDVASEAYDEYLLSQPAALFYHSSKFKNFLGDLLAANDVSLIAVDGSRIRGVLPLMEAQSEQGRVFNSLPYYGSNGGILADNTEVSAGLIKAYNAIAQDNNTLASTLITNPFLQGASSGIIYNHISTRIGQFTDLTLLRSTEWEVLLYKFDSSARRNVKKALSAGISVEIDFTQMDRLRDLHQENMRVIGGPPKTDAFFANVQTHFTAGVDYNLYVAKQDDRVIAGLLLFYFNETVEYYVPAIDNEYRSLQPLSLIVAQAICDATDHGFSRWNWGGTHADQIGVYRFKRKWAALEREYTYFTHINNEAILSMTPFEINQKFPNFFVVPFSALLQKAK